MNSKVSLYAVPEILKQQEIYSTGAGFNADRIIGQVCEQFNVLWEDVNLYCRKREVILPRQIIMYLLATKTKMPLKAIGMLFTKKYDHTTVIHSRETIKDLVETNDEVRHHVNEILISLGDIFLPSPK